MKPLTQRTTSRSNENSAPRENALLFAVLNAMLVALLVALFLLTIKQRNALLLGNSRISELNQRVTLLHSELAEYRNRLAKAREDHDELMALADSQTLAAAEATKAEPRTEPRIELAAKPQPRQPVAPLAERPEEIPVEPPPPDFAKMPEHFNEMIINQRVRDIEEFTQLSEDQKQRLIERFTKEREILSSMRAQGSFDPMLVGQQMAQLESVESIIGEDTANSYREHQRDQRQVRREQRNNQVVESLSSRLALEPQQQERTREVYAEVQEESRRTFAELNQQALAQGSVDMKRISEMMKIAADRRKEALINKMRAVLSPDQFERFEREQNTNYYAQ